MALSHEYKYLYPDIFSLRRKKMEIRILGTGCPRCNEVEKRTMNVLAELDVVADVRMIKDINEIIQYGIYATPGLVINGKVKSSGRIPTLEEIKTWILKEK